MTPRSTADLFAAAREDAPSSLVRNEVWGRIAEATAVPATAAGAGAVVKTSTSLSIAPAAGSKVLALSAALGAAGAAVTVVALGLAPGFFEASFSADRALQGPRRAPTTLTTGPAAGARRAEAEPRGRAPATPTAMAPAPAAPALTPIDELDEASSLAEEARLVTEARQRLVSEDAAPALALLRRTHNLPVRALEPEELALESRALRALGRTDEALATELTLRRRFPSHALAR
jgi:hypothetical protein